ncbi:MAG: hypothetical protein GX456_10745, partial [Verrucomicrobia bacterium]|nr:hypothetical protein [Verrucomicrobiota bacterium]
CTRWKRQRRWERGRPRPHQPDDRSYTRFDYANPAPDYSPAWGGQEWPRSCTRWKRQRRWERGRPRPHQPDDRSCTRFNHANPSPERSPVGCEKPEGGTSSAILLPQRWDWRADLVCGRVGREAHGVRPACRRFVHATPKTPSSFVLG